MHSSLWMKAGSAVAVTAVLALAAVSAGHAQSQGTQPGADTNISYLRGQSVVPVYQGVKVLGLSLAALARSTLSRECWELIVVDDGSTDASALVAARFADIVVRLPGKPRGPAYARNRGFEASRGDLVVFVDADVCVHPDTLGQFIELFDSRPDVSAIFGSYDSSPSHPGVISEFRNLLHHHVHQRGAGPAETFWTGLGAIR